MHVRRNIDYLQKNHYRANEYQKVFPGFSKNMLSEICLNINAGTLISDLIS